MYVFTGVADPMSCVCLRVNLVSLVQQGTVVTLEHLVYLVSMVYLGLLEKKVERWVHIC